MTTPDATLAELEACLARRERIMWPALLSQAVLAVVLQVLAQLKAAVAFCPLLVVWAAIVCVFAWAITVCFRLQRRTHRMRMAGYDRTFGGPR